MQASVADYTVNLLYQPETAVSYLNVHRPVHRQVEASYASYAWLPLAQLNVLLDISDFG
jgi:hypothetical protein